MLISKPGRALETAPPIRRPGDPGFVDYLGNECCGVEIVHCCNEWKEQPRALVLISHQRLLAVADRRDDFLWQVFAKFERTKQQRHRHGHSTRGIGPIVYASIKAVVSHRC